MFADAELDLDYGARMKRIVSTALAVFTSTGAAVAADALVPVYKAPVYKAPVATPSPVFSWTGLYVGVHGGATWSNTDWFYPADALNSVAVLPVGPPFNVSSGGHSASSWLAGGQIGYNYQIKNWVLGAEAEFSWTNLQGSNIDPTSANINHTKTDFVATMGGRFGYAWDRLLLFGKAGGAWAHDKFFDTATAPLTSGTFPAFPITLPAGSLEDQATLNRFGLMLGGGVEYALTPNWSVKAEYEYLDFGRKRVTLSPAAAGLAPFDADIRQRIQLAKVGINYKLDPSLPAGAASAGTLYDKVGSLYDQVGRFARQPRFYGGVEYLLWSVKGAPLSVPLVSSGPEANKEGFLLDSNTTILYGAAFAPASGGNDKQNFRMLSGSRVTLGYWLDDAQNIAVEASGFVLQRQSAGYSIASNPTTGEPGIRVPVHNNIPYRTGGGCDPLRPGVCLIPPAEDGVPISVPGELYGSVNITNRLQLWGADATVVLPFYHFGGWDLSALAGLSYLQLTESFNMKTTLAGLATSQFYAGQSGYTIDEFDTRNQFIGAVLGLRGQRAWGPLSLELSGRIALGVSHEVLDVTGYYQDFGAPFASSSGPYGIFAMPANEGHFTSNEFAVVPQGQVKLGYDLTPSLRVTVGYDFLYDSNVIRPTDQINRDIPKGQTYQQDGTPASTSSPARLFKTTDFYAHGLNVGLNVRL